MKAGELVDFLFLIRPIKVGVNYLNKLLIPPLCLQPQAPHFLVSAFLSYDLLDLRFRCRQDLGKTAGLHGVRCFAHPVDEKLP